MFFKEIGPFKGSVTSGEAVGREWLDGINDPRLTREDVDKGRSPSTPPSWHSARCMTQHWMPGIGGDDVDPGGYLLFSEAR